MNQPNIRIPLAIFLVVASFNIVPHSVFAQSTEIIAVTGTAAPEGGTFSTFFRPVISNSGKIVFRGSFESPAGEGIFLADNDGSIRRIVANGQEAPGGSATYSFTSSAIVNGSGLVNFAGFLSAPGFGVGLYQGDGVTGLTEILRTGNAVPGGNGTFNIPGGGDLNNAGQVGFSSSLNGTSGGTADNNGVFLSTPSSPLTQIARKGQAAPDADGAFSEFVFPLINGAGQVSFQATLTGTANGEGVFRGDGGTPVQIARVGQTAPDLDGAYTAFGGVPDINASGKVAFSAALSGTNASGIFLGDGTNPTIQFARAGQPAPDANGSFSTLYGPDVNDSDQILFVAMLSGTSGSTNDDWGLFRGNGVDPIVQIARKGGPLPDGNGTFFYFPSYNINSQGQVAFFAELNDYSGERGIYFYDDSTGLQVVTQTGNALLGSTITQLDYSGGGGESNPSVTGLSDQGTVTFEFVLADGREGVALWDSAGTPPASPDVTPPVLTLKGKKKIKTSRGRVKISGTATDASGIARVEFQPGKGRFKSAKLLGGGNWKAKVRLDKSKARTKVKVRATDNASNSSPITKVKVIRT